MKSFFASPERTSAEDLLAEIKQLEDAPVITGLLQTVTGLLAVLDQNRQILAVNDSFLEHLGIEDPQGVLGLRPGETLGCPHAQEGPGGCGTSRYCSTCGAAIAIVTSLAHDEPVERLCALTTSRGNDVAEMALKVRAHPLKVGGLKLVLLFLQDVTEQEQRFALERTFFHDVSNLLMSLVGATELLPPDEDGLNQIIQRSALALQKEVFVQKLLLDQGGEGFGPLREEMAVGAILQAVQDFFSGHPIARHRRVDIAFPGEDLRITTDRSLVVRVLANMVTNALETTPEGGGIKVWVEASPARFTFRVWNQGWIPPEVAGRVFQRSFSTKEGRGRGLGTFSMKLVGEKILGGEVGFSTAPAEGTIFQLALPR